MRLLIVSGRSGSGKTISLNALEDLGFHCIDNLPVEMLPTITTYLQQMHPKLAVSIDARNLPSDVNVLKEVISQLKEPERELDILYLDAQESELLRRFSETRRRHPLTKIGLSLNEAIQQEKELLGSLANMANITIDTSYLSKPQLSSLIRSRVARENESSLQLLIQSFGFKNGLPSDADFIFDVRCLPNPYWQTNLRMLNGLDSDVVQYLEQQSTVKKMVEDIMGFLENWIPHFESDNRSYLTVGVGCTGGRHRSVYIVDQLLKRTKSLRCNVQVRHRDL
ncbi:MAG: RNase adapter RapZ [Gammaproteobacteria bacterium]